MPQLATRIFQMPDQQAFAAFSGDANPMHMDPLAARRTQAGAPVVHGMHLALWSLETLAQHLPAPLEIASIRMRADRMVYLGEPVTLTLSQDPKSLRLDLTVNTTTIARLALAIGPQADPQPPPNRARATYAPERALDLTLAEIEPMAGLVAFAQTTAELFPAAAAWLGPGRVAALACTTRLVGMVCPGLHSIFGGLTLTLCPITPTAALAFHVSRTDPRFSIVTMKIAGGGIQGTVESFLRTPPVAQPPLAELAELVTPGQFANTRALIVGGSRGLGEATAKLLAAGGAHTTITYATGQEDAARIAAEIGSSCTILPYNALLPAAPQIAALPQPPTHLYYFATPHIARARRAPFEPDRLAQSLRFYAIAFHDLIQALQAASPTPLRAFYPSSVFVEDPPIELLEYAMAKAAGETLCHALNATTPTLTIHIARLPRIATDQNASITQLTTAPAARAMLPWVEAMQGLTNSLATPGTESNSRSSLHQPDLVPTEPTDGIRPASKD